MLVLSAPSTCTPMETNPREYITDTNPLDVPDTTYYRRLLDDGSLVLAKLGKQKKEVSSDAI